jgi:hypothetical protein
MTTVGSRAASLDAGHRREEAGMKWTSWPQGEPASPRSHRSGLNSRPGSVNRTALRPPR